MRPSDLDFNARFRQHPSVYFLAAGISAMCRLNSSRYIFVGELYIVDVHSLLEA